MVDLGPPCCEAGYNLVDIDLEWRQIAALQSQFVRKLVFHRCFAGKTETCIRITGNWVETFASDHSGRNARQFDLSGSTAASGCAAPSTSVADNGRLRSRRFHGVSDLGELFKR